MRRLGHGEPDTKLIDYLVHRALIARRARAGLRAMIKQAKKETEMEAKIIEQGNGFPDVGDIIMHNDGRVFRIVEAGGTIHTGDRRGNFIFATVEETVSDAEPFEARIEFE